MRNWEQIVREQLQSSLLTFSDSVASELASHLQEAYDAARSRGLIEPAAFRQALQEIPDWRVLGREIHRATSKEGSMNHRTKSLWLPALLTFLGGSASLMLCQLLRIQPRMLWFDKLVGLFYLPWLATLPIFGALGAYLSRRAQGAIQARLIAALSPSLIMLAVMCLILPWGLYIDGLHSMTILGFGLGFINWVAVPALALLLGAMPFLKDGAPEASAKASS